MAASFRHVFIITLVVFFVIVFNNSAIDNQILEVSDYKPSNVSLSVDDLQWDAYYQTTNFSSLPNFLRKCKLPQVDPFDETIRKFINFDGGDVYESDCKDHFRPLSTLSKGKVIVELKFDQCFGRCVLPGPFYRAQPKLKPWNNLTTIFECDVVEVACRNERNGTLNMTLYDTNADYKMLHTQIYKPTKIRSLPFSMRRKKQYNVVVYLLDALGSTAAERYLPRLLRYMEQSMKAVKFPYVNRVAFSSKHNGFSLFYGKTMEAIDRLGFGSILPDETEESICRRTLDNDISIFHQFQEMGYVTMYTDDYKHGLFAYPACRAIRKHIMDHTFDELFTYSWYDNIKNLVHGKGCQHAHNFVNNMTKQVFAAYPDKPKFIWNWLTKITHDRQQAAHVIDRDFIRFFHENRPMLDDSFVIVMADHGCRGCGVAATEIGKFEYNNPLYIISLPKVLRKPELLGILKENSGKLQSHYDTRATLLDIVKYQPLSNFEDRKYQKIEGERGSSLLREQPGDRTCFTLPIPYQYCICEQKLIQVDRKSKEAAKYGKIVIDHVNAVLEEKNMTGKCATWIFNEVASIYKMEPFEEARLVKITVLAKPYEKARIMTTFRENEDGSFTFGTLDRADRYEKRNDCDRSKLQAICDCRTNWT